MIHQILLALMGCSGQIIQLTPTGQFKVKPNIAFIDQAEKQMIEKLVSIASFYIRILKYIEQVQKTNVNLALKMAKYQISQSNIHVQTAAQQKAQIKNNFEDGGQNISGRPKFSFQMFDRNGDENNFSNLGGDYQAENPSAYIKAFALGASKVLQAYRLKIVMLQQYYLKSFALTYFQMIDKLNDQFQTLPVLYSIIAEIEEYELKGGQLLDCLNQKFGCYNQIVKKMLHDIILQVNHVFYSQLRSWLLYGQLSDFGDQFFISRISKDEKQQTGAGGGGGSNQNLGSLSPSDLNNNFSDLEGSRALSTVKSDFSSATSNFYTHQNTMKEKFQNMLIEMTKQETEADALYEWSSAYTVRMNMIPRKYLTSTVTVDKILFIGKAVRVLQHESTDQQDRLPAEEIEEMSQVLFKLEQIDPFFPPIFAEIIQSLRVHVSNRLWQLIVIKGDLKKYFQFFKNFFLFGKGEFYQQFIQEARGILSYPPTSSAAHDLNHGPLQNALLALDLDGEVKKLQFAIRSYGFDKRTMRDVDGLSLLGNVRHNSSNQVVIMQSNSTMTSPANSNVFRIVQLILGAVWHSFKQKVDQGFKTTINFSVRFQKQMPSANQTIRAGGSILAPSTQQYSRYNDCELQSQPSNANNNNNLRTSMILNTNQSKYNESNSQFNKLYSQQIAQKLNTAPSAFVASFIMQNQADIIAWKVNPPKSRNELVEYFAVEVRCILQNVSQTIRYSDKRKSQAKSQQISQHHRSASTNQQVVTKIVSTIITISASKPTTFQKLNELIGGRSKSTRPQTMNTQMNQGGRDSSIKDQHLQEKRKFLKNVATNQAKEIITIHQQPAEINILKGQKISLKIEYIADEKLLNIHINDFIRPLVQAHDVVLPSFIKLDNGTCFVGIAQQSQNCRNTINLQSWDFLSAFKTSSSTFQNQQNQLYSRRADDWQGLCLQYRLKWPMHLIFSQQIIQKYNTLFGFLFPLKRLQLQLQRVWKNNQRLFAQSLDPIFNKLMHLRSNMAFLVNNLIAYLQLDVLQGQFKKLKEFLVEAKDFQNVRAYHDQYLATIMHQFFIMSPKIMELFSLLKSVGNSIWGLVDQAGEFLLQKMSEKQFRRSIVFFKRASNFNREAQVIKQQDDQDNLAEDDTNYLDYRQKKRHSDQEQDSLIFGNVGGKMRRQREKIIWTKKIIDTFENVSKKYDQLSVMMFRMLSNQRIYQTQPELAQLLTRIDFNNYFTLNMYQDL